MCVKWCVCVCGTCEVYMCVWSVRYCVCVSVCKICVCVWYVCMRYMVCHVCVVWCGVCVCVCVCVSALIQTQWEEPVSGGLTTDLFP